MRTYLDDNLADPSLLALLKKAGHSVIGPADVGLSGATDPRHLECAIKDGRVILTADSDDFRDLHSLLQTAGGSHHGILLVRFDNIPKHDMKPKHMVAAIKKLEQSGLDLTNQLIILNHWR
jgi:predicted nuclease of predicted toxin-antitoxin system